MEPHQHEPVRKFAEAVAKLIEECESTLADVANADGELQKSMKTAHDTLKSRLEMLQKWVGD